MIILEFLWYSWWKKNQKWVKFSRKIYNMIQTQFHAKIQVLKTDNARDYINFILGEFLLKEGIVHQSSCINTPQQNRIAERKNGHLLEVARVLMISSYVPNFFGEKLYLRQPISSIECFLVSWVSKYSAKSFSNHNLTLDPFLPFHWRYLVTQPLFTFPNNLEVSLILGPLSVFS